MRERGVLFLGIACFLSGCGQSGDSVDLDGLARPSNLSVVTTQEYPAVVKVVNPSATGFCTGTFISPRAVLTAAHCTLRDGTYTIVTSFGNFYSDTVYSYGAGTVSDTSDMAVIVLDDAVADPSLGRVLGFTSAPSRRQTVRLVGFGCNSTSGSGGGKKRTGTNQVSDFTDYIELITDSQDGAINAFHILGPQNRAASCFGDSGGPLLVESGSIQSVVGIVHSGSWSDDYLISQYINLNRSDNLDFLADLNTDQVLGINFICSNGSSVSLGQPCSEGAFIQILAFLKRVWVWLVQLF